MMRAGDRLLQLGKQARDQMARVDGQWRLDAAREAVKLSPDPVHEGGGVYRLQHALREALMAGAVLSPGTRVFVARACRDLAAALALAMDGEGLLLTGAEIEAPRPESEDPRRYWIEP